MMGFENMHGWGMGMYWILGLLFICLLVWLILIINQHSHAFKKEKESAKDTVAKGLSVFVPGPQ